MPDTKNFSFLLFSDLHNHKDKNFNSTQALNRLTEYLKKKAFPCDYIFIAGDIANQCDYTDTREYITNLRNAVPLPKDNKQRIFWAVGNHDIKRDRKMRNSVIQGIRAPKEPETPPEAFEREMKDEESRMILTQTGMREYLEAYRDVCEHEFPQSEIQNAHRFFPLEELNLFVINTCLTSCDKNDNQNLFISENRLHFMFDKARTGIPTIVLGHHGKEFFQPDEQNRIYQLFQNRVDMYLCGHSHRANYSSFDTNPHEVHQITCGGGKIDGYSKLVVMHGEYDAQTGCLRITPHSYAETGNQSWDEDFRLHSKLSRDNHNFPLTRLGKTAEAATEADTIKQKSAAEDIQFEQSQKFYDQQTSPGGRFAYVKHDDTLLASVDLFETKAILERDKEGDSETAIPKNVVSCVLESDEDILFVGDGGMGKTMSLLRVWQNELVSDKTDRKLPIYVPLNEYNIDGAPRFIYNFVKAKYKIDLHDQAGSIKTVLLLDGFNEITKDNRPIVSEIKDYMNNNNIQVVLTSRYDFRIPHGFSGLRAYHLQPLEKTTVKEYLSRFPYGYDDNMLDVLRNPMMLTLYANTSVSRERIEKRFPGLFTFIENRTVAEILQNYMTCEIGRLAINNSQNEMAQTSVALLYLAPYIAHRLESEGQFSMPKERLNELIREFFDAHGRESFEDAKEQWSGILRRLNVPPQKYFNDVQVYAQLLTNEHHVFLEEDVSFIFRHQYFRDFLSAMYMKRILKKHDYSKNVGLPSVLRDRSFTPNIARMLGECLGERDNAQLFTRKTALHNAIDAMRGVKSSETGYALNNVINCWKEARQGRIIGEDLSELDLTHVLMNGIRFSSKAGATHFNGAVLSVNSLLLIGHSAFVTSAVYSPDGRRVLSASYDRTVREWDSETGECLRIYWGHSNWVNCAVYSPDGRRVLSASYDSTIREWDSGTGEKLRVYKGHSAMVNSAVYSADGRRVLSASGDNTIKEWSSETGLCLKTFEGHSCPVQNAVYSADERRVLTVAIDNTIKEWNRVVGECMRTCKERNYSIISVVCSTTGWRILSVSDDSTIREWDFDTGECFDTNNIDSLPMASAVYSADGRRVLSTSGGKTIREWDIKTGEDKRTYKGHKAYVTSAVYSPDGRRVLSASHDKTIREWDSRSGECLRVYMEKNTWEPSAVYSADGRRVLIISNDRTIMEWDSKTSECLRVYEGHSSNVTSAVYSADRQRVLSSSWDRTIREWDSGTGECLHIYKGYNGVVTSAVYSTDGQRVLSTSGDTTIREWDCETRSCIGIYTGHSGSVTSAVYSADGQRVLSASWDRTIREWDRKTEKCINIFTGHSSFVASAVYSVNGKCVLSASADNTIREWSRKTSKCIKKYVGHSRSVTSAVYSVNGQYVLSTSDDSTIREWDKRKKECRKEYIGHSDSVTNAVYSADGRRVLSASSDGTIREWDRETGECLTIIQLYSGLYNRLLL